jgi:glucose/arabinose dehydrogenase
MIDEMGERMVEATDRSTRALARARRRALARASAVALIGVLAALVGACTSSSMPGPPNPTASQPAGTPTPVGATPTPGPNPPMALTIPSGFHIYMVSNSVPGARFMAFAPNGDLLVSETSSGKVVAIKPGASETTVPTLVAGGLNTPHGLAFHGGDLYIAVYSGLDVIRNYPSGTLQTLYSGLPTNGDHINHSLAIAPDGSVFESSGSDCNLCTESDPKLATIMHMNSDGSGPAIYATGVRNGSGLAFDASGQLWMVVNQRDDIPPDHTNLPAEEFDRVVASGNYGWPICYPDLTGARQVTPDYIPKAPNCNGQTNDTMPMQAHSAPLGIAFYNATLFPAQYRGGAFVAFHGSWDRVPRTGYKVVYVTFNGGNPTGYADFVTGWLDASQNVSGRPVGLAVAPDGELYISDDSNGFIYRVSYG